MIIHRVEQGSLEWLMLRLGIPTASRFSDILTPSKLAPSKSQAKYMAELVAEWALSRPLDDDSSVYMERGREMEETAIAKYELLRDVEVDRVGFITTDDGLMGCSPDGLVEDDGDLEVKCPSAKVHMEYLLNGGPLEDYTLQQQGRLGITGRRWTDFFSYHPTLPPVLVRFARDERIISAVMHEVPRFASRVADAKQLILSMGYTPPPVIMPDTIIESGRPKIRLGETIGLLD